MLSTFGMDPSTAPPGTPQAPPAEGGIETSLLAAILTPGRLSVVFQPIFDVTSPDPKMYGVECLIRGPRGTNAEKPSVLFEYVRRRHEEAATDRACVAAVFSESAQIPKPPRLSFNVHASTLGRDEGFARYVADAAQANGLSSREIVVEIVEHAPPFDVPGFR
jgi:EAL domain-containing protein (putative c-di-GMP-specific phosphodiesterase class I)